MQGGFVAPAFAPQNQRMYDAPPPMPDASMLPPQVAQAAQTGFAPVPSGVVDGLGAPGSPQYAPPVFQPQPLANPFPALAPTAVAGAAAGAAPSKADVAAAKDTVAAQAADAKAQAKQAAYDATPQGEDDAALKASLGINQDQQAIVAQQGDLEAKAAQAAADKWKQGLADQAALDAKAAADREANLAQQKQMIDQRGKDIEAAAKRVPDPNRFYNSLSTMQHIGVGLMTLLAGAGQGLSRDNGVNPVVKMMTDAQDRDIDAQKAGIEQGNKAIDAKKQLQQDYGHLGDDENAMWQYRKAQSRVMLADQIEATAAQYKAPKALLAAKMAADGLRAEAAKMVGAQADRRLAQQNKDEELKNQRQSIAIAGYHAAIADREQRFGEKKFGIETAEKDLARRENAQDKLDQIAATAAAKAAAKGKAAEGELMVPTGAMISSPFGGMTPEHTKLQNQPVAPTPDNPTGENPFSLKTVGGPAEQAKVSERFNAGTKLVNDLDELRALYAENGGQLNKWNATARAKMQSLTRAVIDAHQAYGIAGFKGPVVEMMDKSILGTDDESAINAIAKDMMPQLDSARQHELQARRMALGPNFTGDAKQLDIPDPLDPKNKPKESNQSKFDRIVETTPPDSEAPHDAFDKIIEQINKPGKQATEFGKDGLSDDQRQVMNSIVSALVGFKTHEHGVEQLQRIVGNPKSSSAIRDAAQSQLDLLGFPKVTVNDN